MRTLTLVLLLATPFLGWSQSTDSTSTSSSYSPLELDISVMGHSLFGDGIGELPGKTNIGYAAEAALKYRIGDFGIAIIGGFWSSQYEPTKPGVAYTARLENISAHYILAGPYYTVGSDKFSLEINPKVGVQRFYFPHLTGRSTNNGNTVIERVRTDFDAGISAGLGLKAKFPIDLKVSVHIRADYLTTLGDEAFKYRYTSTTGTLTNTNPLQSISFGAGASLALSNVNKPKQTSLAPTALDVGLGAGLNALLGKGIKNLPGDKSVGYDAGINVNYRIGRSGLAIKGGFWDNQYDRPGYNTRLDNLSAHYLSFGPIIPVTPKSSKVQFEAVPHIGIQRIYFPHSPVGANSNPVTTNLEAGWSAGLTAKGIFPINAVLDLVVSADYTSMLTDRGFGFTVRGAGGYANREPLQRINVGAGVAYNLFKKVAEVEVSPEDIQKMIEEKEDDSDADGDGENTDGTGIGVGGDGENNNQDTKDTDNIEVETVTEPEVTRPTTTAPVTTAPTTTTPSTTTPSTTAPITTSPTTTYPSSTTTTTSTSSNVVYRVQFVALSKDVKVFNELKQYGSVILEYYSAKGLYRYMVGDATTEEEGLLLLSTVRNNGWPKAFLVRYAEGTRTRIR